MPAELDALNYPYIRVRDVNWLKRTLLIFPHVARMTPERNAPADDPAIEEFVAHRGARGPLLRSARLYEPHVRLAQERLVRDLTKLFERAPELLTQCRDQSSGRNDQGRAAVTLEPWERRLAPDATFQIHAEKLYPQLVEYLRSQRLAWEPRSQFSDGYGYIEMNPRLGEAVMATLAQACAENEGLQVVTEFPQLHERLIGVPRDDLLKAALDNDAETKARSMDRVVAEFLVFRRCNVEALSAEDFEKLKQDGDALPKFRAKLAEFAATLPPDIRSERALEERINDELDGMFSEWRRDQANFSSFGRRFFGDGVTDLIQPALEKMFETALAPQTLTPAAAGAAAAATGVLHLSVPAATAAGFAVGVFFRAVKTWGETLSAERNSPYRYLSILEKEGVAFTFSR